MLRAVYNLVFNSSWEQDEDICYALGKAKKIFEGTDQGLRELSTSLESAKNEEDIKLGFDKINNIMRFLLRVSPGRKGFKVVREAIKSMGISDAFEKHLMRSCTLEDAILGWKVFVLQKSWTCVKKREAEDKRMKMEDEDLMRMFFPKSNRNKKTANVKFKAYNNGYKRRKLNKVSKRTFFTSKQFSTMKRKGICYYFLDNNCQKESYVSLNI